MYKTNTKDAFIHRIFTLIVMVTAKIIANISTLIDEAHTISINPFVNETVNASRCTTYVDAIFRKKQMLNCFQQNCVSQIRR